MMLAVYLLLALVAVWAYAKRQYVPFLLCYFAIVSQFFMLDGATTAQRCCDVCILINIAVMPFVQLQSGRVIMQRERSDGSIVKRSYRLGYSLRNDTFAWYIVLYLLFYLLELFLTVMHHAETFSFAFKVVRVSMMLLGYFAFRAIPLKSYSRFFELGLYITLVQGVLFLLQFAGIHLLAGYDEEKVALEGFVFANNIPHLTYFYIFYVLKEEKFRKVRYFIFVFLFVLVLLTFVRAVLIALVVTLLFFFLRDGNRKVALTGTLIILVLSPFLLGVFQTKSNVRNTSTMEDISQVATDIENIDLYSFNSGTLTFRIAMLAERIQYLNDEPQYALMGVGAIHEDSPNCYNRFNFLLGTANEEKVGQRCQIDSGDIAWVPVVLRYGWLGTLLHLAMFFVIIILAWPAKGVQRIIVPIFFLYFINTFDSVFFEAGYPMFFVSLMMAWYFRSRREKEPEQAEEVQDIAVNTDTFTTES